MQIENKYIVIGLLAVGLLSYAGGRYLQPARVITETKEVVKEVIKIVKVEKKASNVVTQRETTTNKAGETIVKETIIDKSESSSEANSASEKQASTDNRTEVKSAPRFTAGLAFANPAHFLDRPFNLGVYGTYQFLGPFSIGAMINKDLSYGVMVGISF